ncbi:MAG: alpha/beta fold hydrolase [Rhizobiaceae bacterium]|nr:alpha/beta fold hydrolase [Rhizobiaceae bacterium]MCV0408838.1 alpha/beta fold hydrolase [Rhizobiaceae bacterium]
MLRPDFFSFDAGAVTLNVATAGPEDAPLIICLHGFPEYWAGWAPVMAELKDRFRVVAPDQRGFNLSSAPEGAENYRARHMVGDLARLADHLSPGRPFVLAGHDWGASVAYAYAFVHPERLSHLVIANGVHPWCFQNAILHDDNQRRASQYINRLREERSNTAMAEDGYRRLFRMLMGFSRTDWMGQAERDAYLAAWSRPGRLRAMLDWYRATPLVVPEPDEAPPEAAILSLPDETMTVAMPHLLIWGEADEALRPASIEGLERFAPKLEIRRFPDAGHWILHEKPREVAAAIREFAER